MKKILIYCVFSTFFISTSFAQNKVFVNQKAVSGGDGKTWATAFNSLQYALQDTLAKSEIWLAEGTYYPTDSTDRMTSFVVSSGYKIYGGFKGNETALQQRDWEKNETILSGNIGQKDSNEDNSYCVVELSDVDSTTILDGLTIVHGNANNKSSNVQDNQKSKAGGGMRIISKNKDCKPQLLNCKFNNNSAQGYGGGAYINFEGSNIMQPLFYNCGFEKNAGGFGGGISIKARLDKDTSFFNKCVFNANQTKTLGTAISIDDINGKKFVIKSCNFNNNKENYTCIYVAIINVDFIIDSCVFYSNKSRLLSYEGNNKNFSMSNSYFEENGPDIATGDNMFDVANAGFASTEKKIYRITNCTFTKNHYLLRTLSFINRSNDEVILDKVVVNDFASFTFLKANRLTMVNSFFYKPSMELASNHINISNATFIAPSRSIVTFVGKEIIFKNNILTVNNSNIPFIIAQKGKIVVSHILSNFIDKDSLEKQFKFGITDIGIFDTLIADKNTILQLNPKFQDAENFDYRLSPCSPAINAGTLDLPYEVKALLQKDLDDNTRIVGNAIDIGAYEYQNDNNVMFSAKITAPSNQVNNGAISLENISGGAPPYRYSWSNGRTTQYIQNLPPGTYTVTVSDKNGCTASQVYTLSAIINTKNVGLSNAYLYPNPTDGLIYLQNIDNQNIATINIYNPQGILLQQNRAPYAAISLVDFPNGAYFYQFQDDEGQIVKNGQLILCR